MERPQCSWCEDFVSSGSPAAAYSLPIDAANFGVMVRPILDVELDICTLRQGSHATTVV